MHDLVSTELKDGEKEECEYESPETDNVYENQIQISVSGSLHVTQCYIKHDITVLYCFNILQTFVLCVLKTLKGLGLDF